MIVPRLSLLAAAALHLLRLFAILLNIFEWEQQRMKWSGEEERFPDIILPHATLQRVRRKRREEEKMWMETRRTTFFVCAIERKLNEEIFVINEALLLCQEWKSLSTVGVGRDEQSSQLTCCVFVCCCGDKSRSRRRIRSHQQCHLLECKKKFSFNDCLLSLMNPHSPAGTTRAETFCAAGAFCDVLFLLFQTLSQGLSHYRNYPPHMCFARFAECRILKVISCSLLQLVSQLLLNSSNVIFDARMTSTHINVFDLNH